MGTFFYVLVMLVNGQVFPHVMGPYESESFCNMARTVNIPEKYPVLQITDCFQVPKET
jgi:hypothetical protein